MDYFDLFDLPVQFKVDTATLKVKFYALNRQYHPDFYTLASPEEQQAAVEKLARINQAWKTLNDPYLLMHYILKEKNILEEDEKDTLSTDFLMEMMDLNEAISEAKASNNQSKINVLSTDIKQKQKDLYATIQPIVENYQEGVTSKEALLQVKTYYYKKKYLLRILEGLK